MEFAIKYNRNLSYLLLEYFIPQDGRIAYWNSSSLGLNKICLKKICFAPHQRSKLEEEVDQKSLQRLSWLLKSEHTIRGNRVYEDVSGPYVVNGIEGL